MAGADAAAASAAKVLHIIETSLVHPPRSNLATWYALLAELHLMDDNASAAATALHYAETVISSYGGSYAEGLVLLMHARTFQRRGDAEAVVIAAARKARDLSSSRGANLFAARAESLLAELG